MLKQILPTTQIGNEIDFSEMFKEDTRATYYAMSDKKVKPGERTQAEIDERTDKQFFQQLPLRNS